MRPLSLSLALAAARPSATSAPVLDVVNTAARIPGDIDASGLTRSAKRELCYPPGNRTIMMTDVCDSATRAAT
jgi:hypothetical protein